tara:strand:+ start:230 stop:406 length:177 start_codon:yes stop_codon:yes gene_type:complete
MNKDKITSAAKAKCLLDRLEFTDPGDGWSYEVWVDPITNKNYKVPIEIVRDWSNIELY